MINIAISPSQIPSLFDELEDDVYCKIPKSSCLGCPSNGGKGCDVTAECCRIASPALYLIEFLNVYDYIQKSWSKEDRKQLIYEAFETILDGSDNNKPCLLLDKETNLCNVYKQRWTNCRTYGMINDFEWRKRAINWVTEKLSTVVTKTEKKTVSVKTSLIDDSGNNIVKAQEIEVQVPDKDKIRAYVDELFKDKQMDIDAINSKLNLDYGIKNAIYKQCNNIEIESFNLDLDSIYLKLAKIESTLVGYDITTDEDNQTYMQFHVYLLFFILGEGKLTSLIHGREVWKKEEKDHFLGLIKGQLDGMAGIQIFSKVGE